MDIRTSVRAWAKHENKRQRLLLKYLAGTVAGGAMIACGLSQLAGWYSWIIGVAGCVVYVLTIAKVSPLRELRRSEWVPDACLLWIANDGSIPSHAKREIAFRLNRSSRICAGELYDVDDWLRGGAEAMQSPGYRAVMAYHHSER
ncbi:hypothetical protein WS86_00215 (plasmid) [Burkholderia savannae]|uniref:hypothetical protein n=1 Tax=Burkholderia savannae TaxID=1637837 RepID=UPI00075988A0|nr:hypothetical protein [Burkholderia savannae]AOJ79202.1 hypothetical protein WS86_00215 [Burkholderia savannae]